MTQLVPSIPLAAVTADQIRVEFISMLKTYFPDWTDQLDSNNMIVLVELFSMLAEINYGYLDRRAREAFIQYALDPNNIVAHARGLGYSPKYQTPAVVDAILKVSQNVTAATPIPIGSKVQSLVSGIVFETTQAYTIPNGANTLNVSLTQWESHTKNFSGDGTPFQSILLDTTPVIPDSIVVTVDGVVWTKVDFFVESRATDNHYRVLVGADGSASIMCGNGISGKVFHGGTGAAAGVVSYKTGGGKAGTIGPYMLANMSSTIRDAGTNALLTITAMNPLASTPGVDRETPDQVRYNAINQCRTSKVLLSLEDIVAEVLTVSGVVATKALNWTTEPSLTRYMIQIFVAPTGLGTCSPALLTAVRNAISVNKQTVMGTMPIVMAANYNHLNFIINLHVKTGYGYATVSQAVHQKLLDLFDPTQTNIWGFSPDFGMDIYSSVLVSILQQIDGVRNIAILSPGDITLANSEFPVVQRTITQGDNGDTWDSNSLLG
jgi:hypothetical protein